ncbi:MAG: sporulation transcription factor Spo0A [Clostridia bacterium]|nr:sporulation transcription factor Spo0A [Clostridia bacterium]
MQRKRIFLLQDKPELNEELKKLFTESGEFEVVGSATDGITGVKLIEEKKPSFVVMELVLPGYDGLCVIEKINALNLDIKIVVLSILSREEIVNSAINKGASYYMVKPFNFPLLKERLIDLDNAKESLSGKIFGKAKEISIEEKISRIFINVGIPPHIKGYSYLREGVKMAVENPSIINNITKKLYPKIGEKFETSPSKVERAIRHAIEVAWNRGRIESINSILGVRAYIGAEKPTNGEFIALVADKMLLEKA